jgi:hypothetical protein
MTKLDGQLDWLMQQIKAFVLSHYGGKIIIDCNQGYIGQICKEPTTLLENGYQAECELRRFRADARPDDTITFVCRKDDRLGQKVKTVLRPPDA